MYLLEYFKSDGKTITVQVDTYPFLLDLMSAILTRMAQGKIISFNVEVINGNVSKD